MRNKNAHSYYADRRKIKKLKRKGVLLEYFGNILSNPHYDSGGSLYDIEFNICFDIDESNIDILKYVDDVLIISPSSGREKYISAKKINYPIKFTKTAQILFLLIVFKNKSGLTKFKLVA